MSILAGKKKYEKGMAHVIDRARIHKNEEESALSFIKEKKVIL